MDTTRTSARAAKKAVLPGTEPLERPTTLDAFFKHHNACLSRVCGRWARGHREDAQDLLAEAYLRAFCAAERGILSADNPIAWLSSIVANLARDQQRARSRRVGDNYDNDVLDTLCDPDCASDALLATRELLSQTLAHVRRLAPAQRAALLARSAGETYEEIAEQLGTSSVNARKLVQVARNELRARLAPLSV